MEEIIVREISSQRDTEQVEAGWNENDKEKTRTAINHPKNNLFCPSAGT